MKPSDIKSAEKVFCESATIGYTKEYFIMSFQSGDKATVYTLTPAHSKRLLQYLEHQLKAYEKEHGAVDTLWRPEIVSPLKRANPPTDLS